MRVLFSAITSQCVILFCYYKICITNISLIRERVREREGERERQRERERERERERNKSYKHKLYDKTLKSTLLYVCKLVDDAVRILMADCKKGLCGQERRRLQVDDTTPTKPLIDSSSLSYTFF